MSKISYANCHWSGRTRKSDLYNKADFSHIVLEKCKLDSVSFIECNMDRAVWDATSAHNNVIERCTGKVSKITECKIGLSCIRQSDFRQVIIINSEFKDTRFMSSSFTGASVSNTKFRDCIFILANISHAVFSSVLFENCRFSYMSGKTENTQFIGCSFKGCKFIEASLSNALIANSKIDTETMETLGRSDCVFTYTESEAAIKIQEWMSKRMVFLKKADLNSISTIRTPTTSLRVKTEIIKDAPINTNACLLCSNTFRSFVSKNGATQNATN